MLFMGINLYAQDVIVKKDGTTIMAKVLSVEIDVVKYKAWNNQDGPTYTIAKTELLSINYINGTKDDFSKISETPQETKPSFTQPNYTPNEYAEAISKVAYKTTAGRGKIISGALLLALVGIPAIPGAIYSFVNIDKVSTAVATTCLICALGGTIVGGVLIRSGRQDRSYAMRIEHTPILQHDFNLGNYTLSPSIDIFNDRMTKKKGIGAGLAFKF